MKKNLLKNSAVQSLIASLLCIVVGVLVGYIALLIINPAGAGKAISAILKNFLTYPSAAAKGRYFGNTLVKTAPLLLCSLSVLFAYKAGLFNIGAAGQYMAGTCAALYAALAWGWGWLPCMIFAAVAGGVLGAIVGLLKAYCNVNEVISGIMLNWISLYTGNMILSNVKENASPYTLSVDGYAKQALIPSLGLDKLFTDNKYVTIAIPLAIIVAIIIMVLLDKTKFGYELKATGNNKNAAKYAGMAENRNIVLTLVISGALAAFGAACYYLTGYEQWQVTATSVPGMGFNGIAAAFLGGLHPVGAILSSFFIQHITDGGAYVDKTMYASQISDLISSLIIYLCGFVLFIKHTIDISIAKREDKKAKAAADAAAESGKGGDA